MDLELPDVLGLDDEPALHRLEALAKVRVVLELLVEVDLTLHLAFDLEDLIDPVQVAVIVELEELPVVETALAELSEVHRTDDILLCRLVRVLLCEL